MRHLLSLILLLAILPGAEAKEFRKLEGRHQLLHPIVLVHGATTKGSRLQIGMFDLGEYFYGIKEFYGATGTPVHVVELSTDGSIGERAAVLKNYLESDLKGKMVNIVAHSLGGLDARYAATILKSRQIASITTIGTPHRGSPVADWAVRQAKQRSAWYWLFRLFGYDIDLRRFLPEITTASMENQFNPRVPNISDIRYYSVASKGQFVDGSMSWILWFPTHWLEGEKHGLAAKGHDGLVPYESQYWGTLIHEATMDHLGQMNHQELRSHSQEEEAYRAYAKIYDNLMQNGL